MIISRSPLRVSFIGGGTDFEKFYSFNRGGVISTSINKYVYVTIKQKFEDGIKLSYSANENVSSTSKIKHKLIKNIFMKYKIKSNIELSSLADIPSSGTGLGSSSAFSLSTISSLRKYLNLKDLNKTSLAMEAYEIEKSLNNSAMGLQDQFASAHGGLNFISFYKKKINVSKISLNQDEIKFLTNNFYLVYTDANRSASDILKKHDKIIRNNKNKISFLNKMYEEAYKTYIQLQKGNIEYLGESIRNSWELKKSFNDLITTKKINDLILYGMNNGAYSSKLLGAGLGGFILFFVPKKNRKNFLNSFKKKKIYNLGIDHDGTKTFKL